MGCFMPYPIQRYIMITVNKRITKRFARFLKEHSAYMYYVRNLINSLNNVNYQSEQDYKRFLTKDMEVDSLFSAFTWASAPYPLNMTESVKHEFWSVLNYQWREYLRGLEHKENCL